MAESQHRVRTALGVTFTVAAFVFGALLLNGAQIASDAVQQSTVEATIDDWIPADAVHRVIRADISDEVVEVVLVGPSTGFPNIPALADQLSDELDKKITVNVSVVVEERLTATGG